MLSASNWCCINANASSRFPDELHIICIVHTLCTRIIKGRLVEQLRNSEVSAPPHLTAHHHISLSTSRHITSHHISPHLTAHHHISLSTSHHTLPHLTRPHHHITTSPHHHITTTTTTAGRLFVAGARFSEVGMMFGHNNWLLLECHFSWQAQHVVKKWQVAGTRNFCIFQYKICVPKARTSNLSEPAGARWPAQGLNHGWMAFRS